MLPNNHFTPCKILNIHISQKIYYNIQCKKRLPGAYLKLLVNNNTFSQSSRKE